MGIYVVVTDDAGWGIELQAYKKREDAIKAFQQTVVGYDTDYEFDNEDSLPYYECDNIRVYVDYCEVN